MKRGGRSKLIAYVAISSSCIASASVVNSQGAFAEPTPAPNSANDSFKNPQERYRFEKEIYLTAIKVRALQIKNINLAFKIACDKASFEHRSAMSIARTPDQKNVASAVRKSAISAAIVARDVAIMALGPEPVAPIEPAKSQKTATKSKSR